MSWWANVRLSSKLPNTIVLVRVLAWSLVPGTVRQPVAPTLGGAYSRYGIRGVVLVHANVV